MAPRKSRKTKTPANHEQPKTTPSINPQNQCPLFNLLPELRNMIYTYAVTRGPGTFFDRALASENLDSVYYKVYAYPPSSSLRNRIALLRTRRRINSEAANIFAADFGELTLVVDVSRARRHLDNYLIPQLDDDQMSRLIRIIVIVPPCLPAQAGSITSSESCPAALHIKLGTNPKFRQEMGSWKDMKDMRDKWTLLMWLQDRSR